MICNKEISKKNKNKNNIVNIKELQLILHDLFTSHQLSDGDIIDDIETIKEYVKNVYLQFNELNIFQDIIISSEIEDLLYSRIFNNDPIYNNDDLIDLTQKIELIKKIPQPTQRSEEWYIYRNNRLTASDLGTAMNINPYSSREKLILKKCGHEEPFVPGPAIEHGVKYEDVAIEIYSKRNNVNVVEYGCIPHPTIPFFGASPDGIIDYNSQNKNYIGRMLEIKCPKSRPITGYPPDYYFAQVQGQLEVCDLEYCDFLECDIQEYNKSNYLSDIYENDFSLRSNGLEKGVLIEQYNHVKKKMEYIYAPRFKDLEELEQWEDQLIDKILHDNNLEYIKTTYWKLVNYCTTLIIRDRELFEDAYLYIKKFWDDVLKYRKNGIESLIKPKKEKKINLYQKNSKDEIFFIND